ncbi:hypothetical protein KY319_01235 [Candidatus Woesearchaeota archaeon]|nr:hypothetical protein [Candidatus Woesearchaeota archaeon]
MQGPDDVTPPEITDVLLTHGPNTLITWTTNEPANSKIQYGNTTTLEINATKVDLETAHALTINTTPGTTYYYTITSCDAKNNCQTTTLESFTAGPFFVKADIPRYIRATNINIPGTTRPGAEVTVIVNGVEVRKAVIQDGTFLFQNINVKQTNNITLKATRETESAQAEYTTELDNQPPIVNITLPAVTTSPSTTALIKTSEPIKLTIKYANQTTNTTVTATSNITIDKLQEGENIITFTAEDKAGFIAYLEERTIYDTGPPKFETTNLRELSPSYRREIHAKGKLSEPGSVTAFVNGKPTATEPTNPDGTFSIPITLERTINYTTEPRTSLDTGIAWKNKIRLEAVDAAGLKTSTEETDVEYTLCGSGTWIDVRLTDPMPDRLNPRMLIEGLQQIGIAFNYTYRGGYKGIIEPRRVQIKTLKLAPEFAHEYDNDLVTVSSFAKPQKAPTASGAGYIQVNIKPIDPWTIEGETPPENATMYEKEKKLSEHRKDHCLVPAFGCMKLFLELEIPFQEEIPTGVYLPEMQKTAAESKLENKVQKTCINVEIMIDQRIPPTAIPSGFLKSTSKVLGKIADNIDVVLKPIETVGQYLFYTCVAGTFLSYVPLFLEKYNCQYKKMVSSGGEKGTFDEKIAEIGMCEKEYGTESEAAGNCKTCQSWKEKRKWYERAYRQICDRVMCPAAPSLQYYLKTKGQQKTVPVQTKNAGTLKMGSDCAAWVEETGKKMSAEAGKAVPPRQFFTSAEIQKIYQNWLEHRSDTAGESTASGVNCGGLHPAQPECCGTEYMKEWSSACGISVLGTTLDTFNEIKESTCLSAQGTGKNEIAGLQGETIQCNKLLNYLSGFCTKSGGPPMTTIKVTTLSETKADQLGMPKYGETNYLYIVVQEQMAGAGSSIIQIGQSKGHTVKLGLVVRSLEFERSEKTGAMATAEHSRLTEKLEIVDYPGAIGFQTRHFTQKQIDDYRTKGQVPAGFEKEICEAAGKSTGCVDGKNIYSQVIASIGSPEKEYIIKPNEGLLNSLRCICFPTIIAYLKLWKNIITSVKRCIDTILVTGDGEAGICQAVISQYGCDLLYEVLACFTQVFSTGGARVSTPETGDIMGALVAAGSEMSRSVDSRYGESATYRAVFVEKKLVHSICMWAFTGTWNFDLATIFDESVESVPIEGQALITPCNRRFVAFNPATRPGGLVTWVYHFGIFLAAGADSEVELHLKCSGGYKCKEANGFERGKCDCDTEREIIIVPEGFQTKVSKNDVLSQELFYTMTGAPGEGQIRYDKAYLVYKWKDGTKMVETKSDECTITQTGGAGALPAFCKYDPLTFSFRCQFGEAPGGLRFIRADAQYPRAKPQAYALGEYINITLDIQQNHPGGEANNKYLEWTIYNSAGQDIANNKDRGLTPLTTNGDYQKTTGTLVQKEWFGAQPTTTTGIKTDIKVWWEKQPNIISPANTVIDKVELKRGVVDVTENKQFVLELYERGIDNIYQLYYAKGAELDGTAGLKKENAISTCGGTLKGSTISCGIADQILTITLKPGFTIGTEKYNVHIDYNPTIALSNPCTKENKLRPQTFKIKFTAYDADQYGQPTDQITMDPMTGQDAKTEVQFNAMCAEANDAELKAMEEGLPPPTPKQEIPGKLKIEIDQMLQTENGFITVLTKPTSWDPTLPHVYTQLQNDLNGIITKETEYIMSLQNYDRQITPTQLPTLDQPITQLLTDLQNVILKARNASTEIENLPIRSREKTLEKLKPLSDALQEAITTKRQLLDGIRTLIGEPTICLPEGRPYKALEGYKECKASCAAPYEPTTGTCTGFEVCCYIPADEYCDGIMDGYEIECKQPGECTFTTTEKSCQTGKVCCKTPAVIKDPYEQKIAGLIDFITKIKSLHEPKLTELEAKEKAEEPELVGPGKRLALQQELIALSTEYRIQSDEIKKKLASTPSDAAFGGNKEKAEEAFKYAQNLADTLRYESNQALMKKDQVQTANVQQLREIITQTKYGLPNIIYAENLIITTLNEALGIRPKPVLKGKTTDREYYSNSVILYKGDYLSFESNLYPELTSWKICAYNYTTDTLAYCFKESDYYSVQYEKDTGKLYGSFRQGLEIIDAARYKFYVEWVETRVGITYPGKSEPLDVLLLVHGEPMAVTPPTPAETPPTKQPKTIQAPILLESIGLLSWGCPTGYISKGTISENDDNWAYPRGSSTALDADESLVLCVSEELTKKYGKDVVVLYPKNSKDEGCADKEWGMPATWTDKGWITSNFDGWARVDDKPITDNEYLHLCVKDDAIDELGDFVYLGIKQENKNDVRECALGYTFQGTFQFKAGSCPFWNFAYAADENRQMSELACYYHKAFAGLTDFSNNWVGLCVKPVTI